MALSCNRSGLSNAPIDNESLVRRAIAGEEEAFAELYRAHRSRIYSALVRYTAHPDEVDDLVQATFIRAFAALKKFKMEAAFTTWLTEIALNVARSHYRRLQVRKKWLVDQVSMESEFFDLGVAWHETPEERFIAKERNESVRKVIQTLPTRYRKIMWLRYVRDRSYAEIVQELQVPMGTVKSMLWRAQKKFEVQFRRGGLVRNATYSLGPR